LNAPEKQIVVILVIEEDCELAIHFKDSNLVDVVVGSAEGKLETNEDKHKVALGFV
jgi:hypothetical protein